MFSQTVEGAGVVGEVHVELAQEIGQPVRYADNRVDHPAVLLFNLGAVAQYA